MKKLSFISLLLLCFSINAQILEVSPAFPTVNDVVTVVYDATQGNAALAGASTIYCHTGVITSTSTSITNWQYVQGTWGTADPDVLMTSLGNNKFSITIDIDQFYGFPVGTNVLKLAFVFRNATGSVVGRSADGSDIYYDIYSSSSSLLAQIFHPSAGLILNLGDQIPVHAETNQNADLTLKNNGQVVTTQSAATVLDYNLTTTTEGTNLLEFVANNGTETVIDSIYYTVNPTIVIENAPIPLKNGANYINDTTVYLQLFAPEKEHIYVIGDFNNWQADINYHMHLSSDSATWWLKLPALTAQQKYGYQYYIDGTIRVPDPLSALVLDPSNDQYINTNTYPDRLAYPTGKTTGLVTVIQPGMPAYTWQNNFQAPAKKDLIIYELLVRDFVAKHNYQTLIDTLDYLDNLGINAIEVMPPFEFEGNESWGYNPSLHTAMDKYYGTPEKFKEFVDSCHGRGIAVIVDMVLNHAFGQNPMVNMYWDAVNSRPAANSPWFNAVCPHPPYCWGNDFDHTKQATKDYVDQVNRWWLNEYNVDGFRFDYTKGFINNGNNFSQDRINILKRMADSIWATKSNTYIILEHWCDNSEEKQLADYGMMLWGNLVSAYEDAGMGFVSTSNLSSGIYTNRTWTQPHLVTYMESHDEERLMYTNVKFGNTTNPDHNAKDTLTALGRMRANAVIFLTQPGPKMIWQFGELGYDVSIEAPCRVCNKPILWNYYQQVKRKELYDVYSAVLKLRNDYPTFKSLDFNYSLTGAVKRMRFTEPSMNGISIANFDVVSQSGIPSFHHSGWWYEYFTGDSVNVSNLVMSFNLKPGEYRIYTDVKLDKPSIAETTLSIDELENEAFELNVFPNPTSDKTVVKFTANGGALPFELLLINTEGKVVLNRKGICTKGENQQELNVDHLPAGNYHVLMKLGGSYSNKSLIIR